MALTSFRRDQQVLAYSVYVYLEAFHKRLTWPRPLWVDPAREREVGVQSLGRRSSVLPAHEKFIHSELNLVTPFYDEASGAFDS